MIKSGSTAWQIIKPGVDLGLIDSIVVTYKTLPGYGSRVLLQKRYPDDTRVNGDELLLPLSQADTTLLREEGGDRVRLELQYNYSSGAVAKSEIQTVHIGDTLATAFVDGSNPDEAQIEGHPIEFAAGDAIVIESENKCVKDWNENDPESEKYIEGRTHYKKPTYPSDAPMIETLTAGATLLYDFTGLSATYINRILYENATDPDGQYPFEWSFEIKLSTGWRATENTSARGFNAEKIDDANFRIMQAKNYDFYLYFISDPALLSAEYANRFPKKGIYVTVNDSGTANIRNFKAGFVAVSQLKRNYIPDSIARTADVVSRQQLAADAGKALVIGEDGVVKPGNVGGTVVVTTTYGENYSLIASHSASEIKALHDAGKVVLLKSGYMMCALKGVKTTDGKSQADFYSVPNIPEDGSNNVTMTWYTVNDDKSITGTYNGFSLKDMTGASADAAGKHGFVPAPAKGDQDKVLHGDGTWREVAGSLIVTITENDDGTYTPSHTSQEIYAAYMGGKSVTALFDSYIFRLAGSFEDTALFVVTRVGDHCDVWQAQIIVAGNKATIGDHYTIPMTPATADEDGASGLVPAPAAGQQDMVLHGDGTWRAVEGGGGSGGGGEWRLLNDIKTTEEIAGATGIRISAADDGTPYNLKEVIFAWRCPAAEASAYATFRVNGKQGNGLSPDYFGSGNFISTGEQKAVCSIKAAGDAAVLSGAAGINNYGTGGAPINVIYNYPNEFETITSIDFTIFGNLAIPTGLSLKIWGLEV